MQGNKRGQDMSCSTAYAQCGGVRHKKFWWVRVDQ